MTTHSNLQSVYVTDPENKLSETENVPANMSNENLNLQTVLQGNALFTRRLYDILNKSEGNIIFSPISIHAILSLAAQGSGGETKEAFINTLNAPIDVVAEGYKMLLDRLNNIQDVTLHMANKVYIKDSYKLKDSFKTTITKFFYSEIEPVDFLKSTEAAQTINAWVENKTNDKIKDLIKAEDLDSDTRLILVNAIYFKGKWKHPFKVESTTSEKFYLNENDTVDVQMMHITKRFLYKYDQNLNAQVLELPYTNENVSMVIILPSENNGLKELEKKLATMDMMTITEDMFMPEVCVSLPKFKIESTIELNGPLSKLGLANIFGDGADFSGILESKELLCVSQVIQKAFIEVNEEGAEAAAATGMDIMLCCLPPPPEIFVADHPFIILLQEKNQENSVIIFKGRIIHPSA